MRILIPINGARYCLHAVEHVAREARRNRNLSIHLLNVQRPLTGYALRLLRRGDEKWYRQTRAERVLGAARRLLDASGIAYRVIHLSGDPVAKIAEAANPRDSDRVVMAATRKNALARLLQRSVTRRLIDRATVPVEVGPAGPAGPMKRYGVPVGIGVGLAVFFLAAD